jgi:hypothetical protein
MTPDILRSEGGGELTPVVVPRSSNSMVYLKRLRPVKYDCSYYFVTRRRLVERERMWLFRKPCQRQQNLSWIALKNPSVNVCGWWWGLKCQLPFPCIIRVFLQGCEGWKNAGNLLRYSWSFYSYWKKLRLYYDELTYS